MGLLSDRMGLHVVFLVGILHLVVADPCTTLKLFDGDRAIAIANNCTKFGTKFCENGPSTFPGNLSQGYSVSKPRDFNVGMYRKNFTHAEKTYLVAGIKFRWKVPVNEISRVHTKGYAINMHPAGSGKIICFVFDLQNVDLSLTTNYHFEYDSFPMTRGDFVVEIISLPPPSNEEYNSGLFERHLIAIPKPLDLNNESNLFPNFWKTWINLQLYPEEAKIGVMFGYPDATFEKARFISYNVQLQIAGEAMMNMSHIVYQTDSSYGIYNFTKVPSGNCTVWVLPVDDIDTSNNTCLCWYKEKALGDLRICGKCHATYTPSFIFNSTMGTPTPSPTAPPPTTSPPGVKPTSSSPPFTGDYSTDTGNPGYSKEKKETPEGVIDGVIAASVVVPVACIALFVAGGCCFWRYRRKQNGQMQQEDAKYDGNKNVIKVPLPEKALKVPVIHRKTVLLLASEDHIYFHQALQNFVRFMELHCQCDVLFAPDHLPDIHKTANSYSWLSGKIDKADSVIIVNSEAAFRLYQAHQSNNIYKDADFGPEGDLFTPGIRHICGKISQNKDVSNIVNVYFEHTPVEQCLPIQALPNGLYKLPNHLKSFLLRIHSLNEYTMDLTKVNLPLQGNVEELEWGKEWLQAVGESQNYESNNRSWFTMKFGQPVSTGNQQIRPGLNWQSSNESGFFESGGSTKRRLSSASTQLRGTTADDGLIGTGQITPGITKEDFYPPSEIGAITIFSSSTVERPPDIDQESNTSSQLRMCNERYDHDRWHELEQQQDHIPQQEVTAFSELMVNGNGLFVLPQHGSAMNHAGVCLEFPEHDDEPECISIVSAQSV